MATSGSKNFSLTRNDIINAGFGDTEGFLAYFRNSYAVSEDSDLGQLYAASGIHRRLQACRIFSLNTDNLNLWT